MALVTGASAGIGAAFAAELAGRGHDLVLTARRGERLRELSGRLTAAHGIRTLVLPADLADPAAPGALMAGMKAAGWQPDMLVNNAGFAVPGDFAAAPWEAQARFLNVMIGAVAALTHLCLPGMLARGRGQVVNLASLAGLMPGAPGSTLYGPAKAWMIAFSEGLALELRGTGVTVTAVCPGFTYSEFHDLTGSREIVAGLPRWLWMDAPTVARQGVDAALRGRPVLVNGRVNQAIALGFKLLPRSLGRALVGRASGRFRRREMRR